MTKKSYDCIKKKWMTNKKFFVELIALMKDEKFDESFIKKVSIFISFQYDYEIQI